MPTTDEGTIDFRRLAVRLIEQRVHAAMEMGVDELAGETCAGTATGSAGSEPSSAR